VRTAKGDIATIGVYGGWESDRDPLMNACTLLLMYAKGRHKPTMNMHRWANALERGDTAKAEKFEARLRNEVHAALEKYPDIAATLVTMSEMSDEDIERIDQVMRETESPGEN
jgi:hypothetical protein